MYPLADLAFRIHPFYGSSLSLIVGMSSLRLSNVNLILNTNKDDFGAYDYISFCLMPFMCFVCNLESGRVVRHSCILILVSEFCRRIRICGTGLPDKQKCPLHLPRIR